MALIKCKECGNQVSSKAEKCPQCGAAVKKKTSGCAMLFLTLAVIIIVGVVTANTATSVSGVRPKPQPTQERPPDKFMAWLTAKDFVPEYLKSPSTAKFGQGVFSNEQDAEKQVTIEKDGTYIVNIWVDSQNSFGAIGRTYFVMHLRYNKDRDTWTLLGQPTITERK